MCKNAVWKINKKKKLKNNLHEQVKQCNSALKYSIEGCDPLYHISHGHRDLESGIHKALLCVTEMVFKQLFINNVIGLFSHLLHVYAATHTSDFF